MKLARRLAAMALGVALSAAAAPSIASGPDLPQEIFISTIGLNPSAPEDFVKGRLGVLQGSFPPALLFIAYRILHGETVTPEQAASLFKSCCSIHGSEDGAMDAWLEARRRVPGAKNLRWINLGDIAGTLTDTANCANNALSVAAATLDDRMTRFGADDPHVIEWLAGQDLIFARCSGEAPMPRRVPDAPSWFQHDRAYQIAAWHLYSRSYFLAAEQFAAIAEDADSPWRRIAVYLAARSLARAVDVAPDDRSTVEAALEAIERVLRDATLAELHAAARRLRSYVAVRAMPLERLQELERQLLAPTLPDSLASDMVDFRRLARRLPWESDLGAWLTVMDSFDHSLGWSGEQDRNLEFLRRQALQRWQRSGSPAWLIAVMALASPRDDVAAEAIDASRRVDIASPAHRSLAWHRIRLLIGRGQQAAARAELDAILALPESNPTTRNLFLGLRMILARDLGEFARFAPRRLAYVRINGRQDAVDLATLRRDAQWMRDPILAWRQELRSGRPEYLDADSTHQLNRHFPASAWRAIARQPTWPSHVQRDVALTAWTRSVLLDQLTEADALVPLLTAHFPAHRADWQAFAEAPTAAAKRFAAAVLMLRLPAGSFDLGSGLGYLYAGDRIGLYGSRWWYSDDEYGYSTCKRDTEAPARLCASCSAIALADRPPSFLTPADLAQARRERVKLCRLPGGPTYLAGIVLDWARQHRDDPRLPEALHLAVRASKYGQRNGDISRRAFTLLHRDHGDSIWAKRTPYWYQ